MAFRTDLNNALAAIVSNNSNSSEPATKYAYQWWVDTSTNKLKIRNSSNNGWINILTTDGGIDVDSGASFFGNDVTFEGASFNIIFDKSDNALEFVDNAKATFGTGADLQIFHNGTNSFISNTTGILQLDSDDRVQVNATELRVKNAGDTETLAKFVQNGTCQLNFDNSTKLETAADRVNIAGHLFVNGGNSLYIQNGFQDSVARINNIGGSNDSMLQFIVRNGGSDLTAMKMQKKWSYRNTL